MPDAWTALQVDVPDTIVDAVANFLLEAGASGVVTGARDLHDGAPGPAAGRARLEAALPTPEAPAVTVALGRYLDALRALDPGLGPTAVGTAPIAAVDWVALAREQHRPVAVGRRLLIAPPWDVPVAHGREALVVEPGMAFGTGQHATTRGCLEAIEDAVDAGGVAAALDVGTGSGVLAAALARLGVPLVVALDVDPSVLPIARATLTRNDAGRVALLAGTAAAVRRRFDLVVANLLADALVAEAAVLAARVAPGGRLVVSGVLANQVERVVAAYPGWGTAASRAEDEWRTLTLVRAA